MIKKAFYNPYDNKKKKKQVKFKNFVKDFGCIICEGVLL